MIQQGNFGFDGTYSHDEKVNILARLAKDQMNGRGAPAEVYLNHSGTWEPDLVHMEAQLMVRLLQSSRENLVTRKQLVVAEYRHALERRVLADEMSDELSSIQAEIEALNDELSSVTEGFKHLEVGPFTPVCPAYKITEVRKFKPIIKGTFTLCQPDLLLQVYKPLLRAVSPEDEDGDLIPYYKVLWAPRPSYVAVEVKGAMRPEHDISQVYKFLEFCPQPVRVIVVLDESHWEYHEDFEDAGAECIIFNPVWAALNR